MTAAPLISRLFIYTAIGAVIAGAAMPHHAAAASFYLQDQSVKGLGRAYSGEVADQGAESLWWNPAAIARSPNEIYIGENSILTSSTVLDRGSSITYPGGSDVSDRRRPARLQSGGVRRRAERGGVVPPERPVRRRPVHRRALRFHFDLCLEFLRPLQQPEVAPHHDRHRRHRRHAGDRLAGPGRVGQHRIHLGQSRKRPAEPVAPAARRPGDPARRRLECRLHRRRPGALRPMGVRRQLQVGDGPRPQRHRDRLGAARAPGGEQLLDRRHGPLHHPVDRHCGRALPPDPQADPQRAGRAVRLERVQRHRLRRGWRVQPDTGELSGHHVWRRRPRLCGEPQVHLAGRRWLRPEPAEPHLSRHPRARQRPHALHRRRLDEGAAQHDHRRLGRLCGVPWLGDEQQHGLLCGDPGPDHGQRTGRDRRQRQNPVAGNGRRYTY